MSATSRLRTELHATPSEEEGVRFFDVTDPASGVDMRLYDFEWLLAEQMDGHRSLEEISSWARASLQLDVGVDALAQYAHKLGELGFFAPDAGEITQKTAMPSAVPTPIRDGHVSGASITPLPPPRPGVDLPDEELALDLADEEVSHRADHPRDQDDITEKQEPLAAAMPVAPPPVRAQPPRPAPTQAPVRPQMQEPEEPEPKSGGRSMMGLFAVLLVLGGIAAYVTVLAPSGAKVSILMAKPSDVVRLYDGTAKLDKAPPKSLSFGEAGKVVDVTAAGTEVKAGTPLATLEGYTKVEKELTDVKDRLGFYQKQLDAAGQKGDVEAQKAAEAKVAEKKKLLAELDAHAQKLRLVAPGPGVVAKVHVTAGDIAAPDEPAVELTDRRVAATFKTATPLKVGDDASLQSSKGGAAFAAKVAQVEGDAITVELPDDGTHKAGDEVRLVKARLTGVMTLPSTAVVRKNGVDTVFVLSQGAVHGKRVTVADRAGAEVYIASGISAGDSVVVSGGDTLTDDQKATAIP